MFSIVPYLVSPVTWRGRSFQRKRARHSRSSAGWFSCTSAGVTKAGEDDPRLAAVDDVVVLVAQVGAPIPQRHRRGVGIGRADAEIGRAPVGRRSSRRGRDDRPARSSRGAAAARSASSALGRLRQRDRQRRWCRRPRASASRSPRSAPSSASSPAGGEEVRQVRLDGEARAGGSRGRHWPRPWWRRCTAPAPQTKPAARHCSTIASKKRRKMSRP